MRVWQAIGAAVVLVAAGVGALTLQADNSAAAKPQKEGPVKVFVYNKEGKLVGPVESARVVKTDEEWQKQLGAETYRIVRAKGTERPFCGNLLDNKKAGTYVCIGCNLPLFSSDSKFNSGTGWPSFFQPVGEGNVLFERDNSHGMVRTEILCARCDGHLGHVFDDGPKPTGLRFCVNSESLKFIDAKDLPTVADPAAEKAAPATQPAK